jgi:hypothetical protein
MDDMNPFNWQRAHWIAFWVAVMLGGCLGFVVGIRRIDPTIDQSSYWQWLGLWVVSGAAIAAAGAFLRQLLRRSERERPKDER